MRANYNYDDFRKDCDAARHYLKGHKDLWNSNNPKISASIALNYAEARALDAYQFSAQWDPALDQKWQNAVCNKFLIEDLEKELFSSQSEGLSRL